MPDLRKEFINGLCSLAEHDSDIMLIVGDVGYGFAEPFIKKYPNQFINCGCMEQTMVGMAAGLALGGEKPYVYTVINFLLFRAWEQVRNDIANQNLNVKLVGVRGKDSYKFLGLSHNIRISEDDVLIGTLPNIITNIHIEHPTAYKLDKFMLESYQSKKPTYIRL